MGKLFLALFVTGATAAFLTALCYLAAFVVHTIGPENWRWLTESDKVRLTGEVRGFAWGLIAVALLGVRAFWDKIRKNAFGDKIRKKLTNDDDETEKPASNDNASDNAP